MTDDLPNEFENYRSRLFAIAYRMTGSAMEAEDLVQETYLRYRAVSGDDIQSPLAYMTTIITRLAINHLNSARVQRETTPGSWLPEPVLTANRPELISPAQRLADVESISMSFLTLLEKLTPAERAVFVLHEVFDYEYREIAEILGKSEAAVRKLGTRAKQHLRDNRPRFEASPEEHTRLLESFLQASGSGDMESLMALLAEDARFVPDGGDVRGRATRILHGRDAVAQFLVGLRKLYPPGLYTEIVEINGRPAAIIRTPDGVAYTVVSITVADGKVQEVYAISNREKIRRL